VSVECWSGCGYCTGTPPSEVAHPSHLDAVVRKTCFHWVGVPY
jgi:hypothetical protein